MYKRSPSVRICVSDKDRTLIYLIYIYTYNEFHSRTAPAMPKFVAAIFLLDVALVLCSRASLTQRT